MDNWTFSQRKVMEAGGNSALISYLRNGQHYTDPQVKHDTYASLALMTYRKALVEVAEGRGVTDLNVLLQKAVADQEETERRAADRENTYKGFGSAPPPSAAACPRS